MRLMWCYVVTAAHEHLQHQMNLRYVADRLGWFGRRGASDPITHQKNAATYLPKPFSLVFCNSVVFPRSNQPIHEL